MNITISLCNQDYETENNNLILSDEQFLELWQGYLNLPFERRVFSPKEVINAIDKKLDPDYSVEDNNYQYLDVVKKLEDICILALVKQDTICIKIEK